MRILIDIGHPAHVHLFKNFAWEMQKKGHSVFFTTRKKEFENDLLTKYGFKFTSFGKKYKSTFGKIFGMFIFDFKMLLAALKFKPDIFLSHGSIYAAQVSWLFRKPHISMEDTGNMEQIKLYLPFTNAILTSYSYKLNHGSKQIYYNGYHELAYLHPNYFTPDSSILNLLGVNKNEKYVIMRFVSWNASHDIGHRGITIENKIKAVKEFSKYAKVFITSEKELSTELKPYQIKIQPEKMHDALAYASLLYGESATMVSEGAVLGIPGIYLDNTGRLYTREQENKYGLVFNYTESLEDQQKSIQKGVELLTTPGVKEEWQKKRERMLSDKIDVTAFMVWFVEDYPESAEIMKKNPEYQLRFK